MADDANHVLSLDPCKPDDHPKLREWFIELATYEGRPEAVTITPERLEHLLSSKAFEASFIRAGTQTIGYTVTLSLIHI